MKVLFSPSEGKIFPTLEGKMSEKISKIYKSYFDFTQSATERELGKMMGYSKLRDITQALGVITSSPKLSSAIELYNGVAYDALAYHTLKEEERAWINRHTLIFSNLFGAVGAEELLPFYKLKQGEGFSAFSSKEVYKACERELDEVLNEEFVLDLRAEFYKKLYMPKVHHFSMEFYKNGKKVSHFGKYYRGIVLRELAKCKGMEGIEEALEQYGLLSSGSKNSKICTTLTFTLS
ncbi:peroxide stress protein YaaA [Helicobacter cholecystus]|uniref:peroxide stress protein YaaA n=1 Tax=Helicobacter cholecystus TaxID=45498 RepID=UPI00273915EE|nr:peroxide stress protein YaaA [Helicobacter cholecystus]